MTTATNFSIHPQDIAALKNALTVTEAHFDSLCDRIAAEIQPADESEEFGAGFESHPLFSEHQQADRTIIHLNSRLDEIAYCMYTEEVKTTLLSLIPPTMHRVFRDVLISNLLPN